MHHPGRRPALQRQRSPTAAKAAAGAIDCPNAAVSRDSRCAKCRQDAFAAEVRGKTPVEDGPHIHGDIVGVYE